MRHSILSTMVAGAAALTCLPVWAMTVQPAVDTGERPAAILIAGGCGPGFHRGFYGRCRPNFYGGGYGYRRYGGYYGGGYGWRRHWGF